MLFFAADLRRTATTTCDCRRHAGISLLEVLISIAVLSIGLLGVVALIPVASQQAQDGARKDAMSIAGRRAFREFSVRGYGLTAAWEDPQQPSGQYYDGVFTSHAILVRAVRQPPNLRAFCIDPVGYALFGTTSQTIVEPQLYTFPNERNWQNDVYLPRHSVKAASGLGRMTVAQVEEVFTFQDDLEFTLPKSSREQSLQQALYTVESDGTKIAKKRYAAGEFSWFATLVPKLGSSSYTLSVAVVRDRTQFGELRVNAAIQTYGGSGEIVLEQPAPDLRAGHWIMVMDGPVGLPSSQQGGNMIDAQYEWYRIVNTDGTNLSVNGADWTVPNVGPPPVAVIVPRTVAVYSKTIPFAEFAQ